MSTKQKKTGGKQRSAIADVVAREYTIHMHKRVSRHHRNQTAQLQDGTADDGLSRSRKRRLFQCTVGTQR